MDCAFRGGYIPSLIFCQPSITTHLSRSQSQFSILDVPILLVNRDGITETQEMGSPFAFSARYSLHYDSGNWHVKGCKGSYAMGPNKLFLCGGLVRDSDRNA